MGERLLVVGLGFTGTAVARAAVAAGWGVTVASRSGVVVPEGVRLVGFEEADVAGASHVLATAPPGEGGDPVLARHGEALRRSAGLRWCGYLSTTGVYGDRGGGWVDETTPVAPGSERAVRRVAAERAWAVLAGRAAVDLFRCAGIYGPGRSALDEVAAGRARRVIRPGHAFGRVHRDDIAGAVVVAAGQGRGPGVRVLHMADDVPAEPAAVVAEAARLLGVALPPAVAFEAAAMSPMAASFWVENRRVASARTQAMLGRRWTYPSYREGLRAIFEQELHGPA